MSKLYTVYFSATDTTRKCVEAFCHGLERKPDAAINLADNFDVEFPDIDNEDVVVVAAPVYGGRLPSQVSDALLRLEGNDAIAIALAVYGNRDYDDALLELTDMLHYKNFRIAGAGVFIGQHSIFPKVAASRPDSSDEQKLMQFGRECKAAICDGFNSENIPFIKGNRPYKTYGGVPFSPKAKEADCVKCRKCVEACPVGAIAEDKPFMTDTSKCICCGRCISVCSKGARHHSGVTYSLIGATFNASFSKRKEPEWVVAR